MDLLTTYIHDSKLQAVTALSLFFTLHAKSSQSAFTCFLVTNLNYGDSSASVVTPLAAG
jgi:hypothetical protein